MRVDNIASETKRLSIYDREKSIDDDAIRRFQKKKNLSDEYMNMLDVLVTDMEPFTYHTEATYIFGYPFAIVAASKMVTDEDYLKKVLASFDKINMYSIYAFLDEIDVSYVISLENGRENLFRIMEQLDLFIKNMATGQNIKRIELEKR